jgi:glycosyltransferase involved in cell wall biosynthesis
MQTVGWVVVPSIWWENSPVVIQEAMRAGTPLVVSDIGGMAEKVRPGVDGLHFTRGSVQDLARVMKVAASTPQDALALTLGDGVDRATFLAGLSDAFGDGAAAPDARRWG